MFFILNLILREPHRGSKETFLQTKNVFLECNLAYREITSYSAI